MQRGRGGRDDISGFGDAFPGFGSFGGYGGFGGFGRSGSLLSSFFGGGRDPFDDPFFTQSPFAGFGQSPFGSLMGPSMFGPSLFGPERRPLGEPSDAGFLEQAPPQVPRSKPVIKELNSDDEEEEGGDDTVQEEKENTRKHSRAAKAPYVQDPDEEVEEKKVKHMQYRNDFNRGNTAQPQAARSYSFHSSTVTYGGPNGAYYTASKTRRSGGDGVVVEESKEADTTTGKATHRVSRGIRDKGHTLTRKLSSDGKVDSMQTLHNLDEDELPGFEEAWKGNARQHLPGLYVDMIDRGNIGSTGDVRHNGQPAGGWALPSTEQTRGAVRMKMQPQQNSFGRMN